jgi:hypothetical protein
MKKQLCYDSTEVMHLIEALQGLEVHEIAWIADLLRSEIYKNQAVLKPHLMKLPDALRELIADVTEKPDTAYSGHWKPER